MVEGNGSRNIESTKYINKMGMMILKGTKVVYVIL